VPHVRDRSRSGEESGGGSGGWQRHREGCSNASGRGNGDLTTVTKHGVSGNRETESGPAAANGPSATIDEWLLAAEYILNEGNPNVMLCERGIRTFETHTRFTLPLATVPYLQKKTHLPVIVDPSHGTGHTYLVPAMAAASVAAGCDGLIVEVHPSPETASSDGYQSLNFAQFQQMMTDCRKIAEAIGRSLG